MSTGDPDDERAVTPPVTPSGPVIGRDGRRMNPASLANLKPGAGQWRPGAAPHLTHGGRTRAPQRSPEWSPAVAAAVTDLQERVGDELRDAAGDLHPWALPSVEAVAVQRVAAWRADRFVADLEARGRLTLEALDVTSRIGERLHKALEREALTLSARLAARRQTIDLASIWADMSDAEEEP